MPQTLEAIPVSSDTLARKPARDLAHLPGPEGHWLFGNAKSLMPNLGPFMRQMQGEHGDCFTIGLFRNQRAVILAGPRANELVLLDRDHNFSSRWGWEVLHTFFGRNILVRDFEDHRQHRRLMTHVFKPDALASYLDQMNPLIENALADYRGTVDVYRQTKQLALDIAVKVFAGISPGDESVAYNQDLNLVLSNAMAHRIRLPGTRYWQGLGARDRLRKRLFETLRTRRGKPGRDLFSQLANQRDEDGAILSDQDVIDHMFGMLFAAHDTTASSLGMIFWLLSQHPDWQDALREECDALFKRTESRHLRFEDLDHLPKTDWVFKESLRLYAPIQIIPRRSVRAFDFVGRTIPANAWIMLIPQITHFDERYFQNPDQFLPERFEKASQNEELDPYAFIPFGRGSHMCLGMHFAHMEIKAVIYQLLLNRRLAPSGDALKLEYLPLVRPIDRMDVRFMELGSVVPS